MEGMMGVELKNITASYKGSAVLRDLNLELPDGMLVSVLGVSGAGKTTLLRVLAGLMKPDSGSIRIDGKDITDVPAEKRGFGYVFQSPLLFPHMTVSQNIRFGLETRKWTEDRMRKRVGLLLDVLSLTGLENRLPQKLSGGQQQRVAIARALAPEPCLLLMDEPFSSLDPQLRKSSGELIRSIQETMGLTIVFVTHDREESLLLSNRIALLGEGRILQADSPRAIYNMPASREVAIYMGECNFIQGQVRAGVFNSPLCKVHAAGYDDGRYELLARPHQIRIAPVRLEDEGPLSRDAAYRVESVQTIGKRQELVIAPAGEPSWDEEGNGFACGTTDKGRLKVETLANRFHQTNDLVTASLFPNGEEAVCLFRLDN
jgi:ABC-type Fe3+/spermidine/putrescine transport system ATPase subunit